MKTIKRNHFLVLYLCCSFCVSCKNEIKTTENYHNQIGDTTYLKGQDSENFIFCDSTNVLHKRAYVRYSGGALALQKEFKSYYNFKLNDTTFNGYYIVRLAVNCEGMAGRFRIESLDSNFKPFNQNKKLEDHILSTSKLLSNWETPLYRGEAYDGYTFFIIKFKNGKIDNYEV